MNLSVWATPTRPLPTPSEYLTTMYGGGTGVNHDQGPAALYPDAFQMPDCVVTVPHYQIVCVVPPGYGAQLQWSVRVLDDMSLPFR